MLLKLTAHLFGAGAMAFLFLIYQQKERKKLLISKLCADVCWTVHYFLLGAYAGMIPNLVGILRELVFVNRERKKWADNPIFPIAFILLNWGLGMRTFESAVNILPIAASTLVTISLWLKKPQLTKILSIPVSTAFIVYDVFVGSYIGIVNESIAIISIIIYFLKQRSKKNG